MVLCETCGKDLVPAEEGFNFHVECIPEFTAIPGMRGMSQYELEIREDIIELVRWASSNSPRSLQRALGCSEAGHPCDRRIGYKLASVAEQGFRNDPWPSIVGTATHSWMETAVARFQEAHGLSHWHTELQVHPSPFVKGHTDLYDARRQLVLDWKFPSPDNLRKMRDEGPSEQYKAQVRLYGLGHLKAGRPVRRVGIVALGRQGWLKDMFVWTEAFDEQLAQSYVDRVVSIGRFLLGSDIASDGPWQTLQASPSRLCTWCPYYSRDVKEAGARGCPGK